MVAKPGVNPMRMDRYKQVAFHHLEHPLIEEYRRDLHSSLNAWSLDRKCPELCMKITYGRILLSCLHMWSILHMCYWQTRLWRQIDICMLIFWYWAQLDWGFRKFLLFHLVQVRATWLFFGSMDFVIYNLSGFFLFSKTISTRIRLSTSIGISQGVDD